MIALLECLMMFLLVCRFHGSISRVETDELLSEGDGGYLVRKSERAPDAFTLAIRYVNASRVVYILGPTLIKCWFRVSLPNILKLGR